MKEQILDLIRKSKTDEYSYECLETIYSLYEQLQFSTNIKQMADDIYDWLHDEFKVDNLTFALIDISSNSKEEIYSKGAEFFLDDDKSYFFIINTHTNLNATVSFCATSKVHYEVLQAKYHIIEAAFFQISPIIQNGILKKNFIESSSLDSVTKVYNRNYLINNLSKHLTLSNNKNKEIFFLMIGVDHFKAVVDEFNYDISDKVLIELAKAIHTNINEFDMVARLNADEFLVTILSNKMKHQVEELAKNIIQDFAQVAITVDVQTKQKLMKTICIGLETFHTDTSDTINDAIKNADIALYEAKNRGRSQFFDYAELTEEDTIDLF